MQNFSRLGLVFLMYFLNGIAVAPAAAAPVSLNIQPESVTVPYGANPEAIALQFYVVNNSTVSQRLFNFTLTPTTQNSNVTAVTYTTDCNGTLPPQGPTGVCNIFAHISAIGAQSAGQKIGPFNYTFSLKYGPRGQQLNSNAFPIIFADGTQAASASRTFTFINQCTQEIWLGISSGATNSITPDPSQSPANLTSCLTNADCYSGSQCVTVSSTLKQCYWLNPAPTDQPSNFKLDALGGLRTSTTVTFPTYNNGIDISWSGGVVARTSCSSGTCETGSCGGTGTGACPIGSGFDIPASKAEFTLQNQTPVVYTNTPNNNTDRDTYDVTVIDGISIPISMGPTNANSGGPSNPYTCGTPGSDAAVSPLGSCTWSFTPPAAFPVGATASHYVWVRSNGSSDCSGCPGAGPLVCGISFDGSQAAGSQLKRGCGTQLGYWTADALCGKDPTNPVLSAFKCQTALQGLLTYANLYACDLGELKQSCYTTPVNTCCGCADWNTLGITVPAPPLTQSCIPQNPTSTSPPNPNWVTHSQQTLQWLKTGCPTAYVYPYDDASSTFTCSVLNSQFQNVTNYSVTFCPEN